MIRRLAIFVCMLATVPAAALRLGVAHAPSWGEAPTYGLAIVAAAFLLTWGSELAQLDINQGLAIAALALIAVLPEYAVDMTFAWKAGSQPERYAPLALANMTGANRLLIGVGWPLVVFVGVLAARRREKQAGRGSAERRSRPQVALAPEQVIEVAALLLAAGYALTLPLRRTLPLYDSVVLVGIFAFYLARIARIEPQEPDLMGPPAWVAGFPRRVRRAVTVFLLLFAAAVIVTIAEPFATSLVDASQLLGVSEFFAVQWLAPLASEAPELLATAVLAYHLKAAEGLGALISSKVNQWTLLVGLIPAGFALSAGGLRGLPIDAGQRDELLLTAAQTLFAVSLLMTRRLRVRGAAMLFGLFALQLVLALTLPRALHSHQLLGVAALYLALAAWTFARHGAATAETLRRGLFAPVKSLAVDAGAGGDGRTGPSGAVGADASPGAGRDGAER